MVVSELWAAFGWDGLMAILHGGSGIPLMLLSVGLLKHRHLIEATERPLVDILALLILGCACAQAFEGLQLWLPTVGLVMCQAGLAVGGVWSLRRLQLQLPKLWLKAQRQHPQLPEKDPLTGLPDR